MAKNKDKNKKKAKLNHKIFFSLLLLCITWLIYSSCYMLVNGGITYDTVTSSLAQIMPYSIIIGVFGYIVGDILDRPNKYKAERENKELIDKMLKSVADQAAAQASLAQNDTSAPISDDIPLKVDTEKDI